ncbi:MAG: DUF4199 family protein [Muribaculaceae bacterium]|nr:DUF4199 family protein [Muribaculaceae bacterium]
MNRIDFKKNIFTLSAELGIPFGILLSILAVTLIFVDKVPFLSTLATLLMLAAPVMLCYFQRKRFVALDGFAIYSDLWVLANLITIGGSLIMVLVSCLTITFFRPDFIYEQMRYFLDTMPSIDSETAETFEKMISRRELPSAIEFSMMLFWLFACLGCLGGAITAFIAEKIPYKQH